MSRNSAAESHSADARTIGDILLARGFVTREVLDEALGRQQMSGKPLGQILVEEGAISRLELASALAEQWSDIGSVSPEFGAGVSSPPSRSGGDSGSLVELEELRLSRRMLEERLRVWETSTGGHDDSPDERTRLLTRLGTVEAAIAALQEHDPRAEIESIREAVAETGRRVDELAALVTAEDGAGARARIDDVDERLAALGAAVERAFQEMERRADESRDAVSSLSTDVAAGKALLDGLGARVESIEELARSAAARPDQAEALSALRGRLDELATETTALTVLGERADALERRFEKRAAAFEARFQELFAARAPAELETAVAELTSRVDALASRPVAEGDADARVAELSVRFDGLVAAVESLAEQPAPQAHDEALAKRLDDLATELAAIGHRPDPSAGLPELVADLQARVAELSTRPPGDPDAGSRLAELSGRLDAMERRPEPDPRVYEVVRALAERAERLERGEAELAARLEQVSERATTPTRDDGAAASLAARLDELERNTGDLAAAVRSLDEASASREADLAARVDAVAARLDDAPPARAPASVSAALAGNGAPAAGPDTQDVERLRMMVERLMHDFAEHRRAVSSALSSREFTALLEELAARVDELQAGGVVAAPAGPDGATAPAPPRPDLTALTRRLDEVEESVRSSRDGVFQRLERMMGTIDWRLQRLEHPEEAED